MEAVRVCRACGEAKPETNEFFSRHSSHAGGLNARCKACVAKATGAMRWGNWGAHWHLDHIVPVTAFNISGVDCPEFRACWALTNLRPLRVKQNLSKASKRLHLL